MRKILLVVVAVVVLRAVPGAAQDQRVPRAAVAPTIDGVIEPAWDAAAKITAFQQIEPAFGTPGRPRTEVFVTYDSAHLYLAARLWQPRTTLHATGSRRDSAELMDGDFVSFVLDPLLNGNSAYFFSVNPAGVVADGLLDSAATWTRDWDAPFVHAVSIADDYWTVEIALPLAGIGFQSKEVQDWGFLVVRRYAEGQERDLSSLADRHHPYRIDTFPRLTGLEGLQAATRYTVTPYGYTAVGRLGSVAANRESAKAGADFRFVPKPALTIVGTVRPDYAQLESDVEVINVSDVPTSYPEKRPFFTESGDLYPGLAVNTRNIVDIDAGLKVRQVLQKVRYDATVLRDRAGANWWLGDARWTDNKRYLFEVIGGLKDSGGHQDYNVTTNIGTWFLDKRLNVYTWYGTINSLSGSGREFESVNAVKWRSRTVDAGVWNHVKSPLYNPNIVGSNALSNEVIVSTWLSKSFIRNSGTIRRVTPTVAADNYRIYSTGGHAYTIWTAQVDAEFHPSDRAGNLFLCVLYNPATAQEFRYRNTGDAVDTLTQQDAFGRFVPVEQRLARTIVEVKTDAGKRFSGTVRVDTLPVRGSTSVSLGGALAYRLPGASSVAYSIDSMRVAGSSWQRETTLTLQRLRVEHTFKGVLNVRGILQNRDSSQLAFGGAASASRVPTFNLAVAWRRRDGSTLFIVYDDTRPTERAAGLTVPRSNARSFAIKMARPFSF